MVRASESAAANGSVRERYETRARRHWLVAPGASAAAIGHPRATGRSRAGSRVARRAPSRRVRVLAACSPLHCIRHRIRGIRPRVLLRLLDRCGVRGGDGWRTGNHGAAAVGDTVGSLSTDRHVYVACMFACWNVQYTVSVVSRTKSFAARDRRDTALFVHEVLGERLVGEKKRSSALSSEKVFCTRLFH